jgi:hypothetical protein
MQTDERCSGSKGFRQRSVDADNQLSGCLYFLAVQLMFQLKSISFSFEQRISMLLSSHITLMGERHTATW